MENDPLKPSHRVLQWGCTAVFLSPFWFTALVFLLAGIFPDTNSTKTTTERLGLTLAGLVFFIVSLAAVVAMKKGVIAKYREMKLAKAHPLEPWLWRSEWTEGLLKESGFGSIRTWFAFAVGGTIFVGTISVNLPTRQWTYILVGSLIALAPLLYGLYYWQRARRYGISLCLLDTMPGVIGGEFRARVQTRLRLAPSEHADVTLECVHHFSTGTGKSRKTHEVLMWKDECTVGSAEFISSEGGYREIPIAFSIPTNVPPTTPRKTYPYYVWTLRISAETTGVDYLARFKVPVFDVLGIANPSAAHPHSES